MPTPDQLNEMREAELRLLEQTRRTREATAVQPDSTLNDAFQRARQRVAQSHQQAHALILPDGVAPFIVAAQHFSLRSVRDEDLTMAHMWLRRWSEAARRELARREEAYLAARETLNLRGKEIADADQS